MPFFSHTIELIPTLVRWLVREATLSLNTKQRLKALLDRVEYARSHANDDGDFLTYRSTESRPLDLEKVRKLHRLEIEPVGFTRLR